MRYLIIGAGRAGISAAEKIRENDKSAEIFMITDENDGFYFRASLKYYISGRISRDQLTAAPERFFHKNKINLIYGRVIGIDTEKKIVQTNMTMREIGYDKLLIATGSVPVIQYKEMIGKPGMRTLRTLADADKALREMAHAKNILFIGGGVLASELAESARLINPDANISIIASEKYFGSPRTDIKSSEMISELLSRKHINVILNDQISRLWVIKEKLDSVVTKRGRRIKADLVYITTGVLPNIALAKETGLKTDIGFVLNEFMQTSLPDIYAAGDCAQFYDISQKRYRVIRAWHYASFTGRIAGHNMSSKDKLACTPGAIHAHTMYFGIPYCCIGKFNPLPEEAENYEILETCSPKEFVYLKLVINDNKVVGACMLGELKDPILIKRAIDEKVNISRSKHKLLLPNFDWEEIL